MPRLEGSYVQWSFPFLDSFLSRNRMVLMFNFSSGFQDLFKIGIGLCSLRKVRRLLMIGCGWCVAAVVAFNAFKQYRQWLFVSVKYSSLEDGLSIWMTSGAVLWIPLLAYFSPYRPFVSSLFCLVFNPFCFEYVIQWLVLMHFFLNVLIFTNIWLAVSKFGYTFVLVSSIDFAFRQGQPGPGAVLQLLILD